MDDSKLNEIKSRINIVDLISNYVTLNKAGKNYKGLCPFHNEKTSSFMVSPELQIFKCFGCGKVGDIFAFTQEIEGLDFPGSLKLLAERAGVEVEVREKSEHKDRKDLILEINHLASEYYNFLLTKHKIGAQALKYVKEKRKLSDKTISDFKIGYAPHSWRSLSDFLIKKKSFRIDDVLASGLAKPTDNKEGYYDLFRGRVVFPLSDTNGNIVGFSARALGKDEPKYINTAETEVFHKGNVLFGLDKAKVSIKREGLAILVEGQVDVISAHQAGFTNVIGTSGTALTTEQLQRLSKLTKDIAFCFDADTAGLAAAERGIELAENLNLNVKVIVIPKPYKDLDECVTADPQVFAEAKNNPVSIYDFYFLVATTKNDKKDPIGKKKIAEELVPVIWQMKSPVLKDHYVKKLANLLLVSEDSILQMLRGYKPNNSYFKSQNQQDFGAKIPDEVGLQEYILNLLLKSPLDLGQNTLYKLGQKDFTDPLLESIFVELKSYTLGRKRDFQIKYFCAKLDKALSDRVEAIYLKEIGSELEDVEKLKLEVSATLKRIKVETAKRELKELSNKIKEAEVVGDTKEVERLTKEFKNVSERLSTHG